jgi:cobaltochelatase CobN
VLDDDNRQFLERANPNALREMTQRLLEAIERGMWKEPGEQRERLEQILLDAEELDL